MMKMLAVARFHHCLVCLSLASHLATAAGSCCSDAKGTVSLKYRKRLSILPDVDSKLEQEMLWHWSV
jgi:hypothetical protein